MTTYTTYVYSPLSNAGTITGRTKYCLSGDTCTGTGSDHIACGQGYVSGACVDIGAGGDIFVRASNVKSIRVYIDATCCGANCSANFTRLMRVELYGKLNGVCYIGTIGYGHVMLTATNPTIVNGRLYNLNSYPLPFKLGTANTEAMCHVDNDPNKPIDPNRLGCCPGCCTGVHSHMQTIGGSVVSTVCCGSSVSSGTAIYKFTWSDTYCSV